MGSLEYVRILERQTGCAGRLFVVESEGGRVAYPYLLRPVHTLPFAGSLGQDRWDTVTPDYTGPLRLGTGALNGGASFAELFAASCREQGIVAEFAHLNPWHACGESLEPACVEPNREIVYIDLTLGMDRIWEASLNTDARRATKQSRKAGVRTRLAESRQDVLEFHRLYALTMERRAALARYCFPPEYFLAFFDTMSDNAFFVVAELEGRMVAGGLYFHDANDVYWHLSAADMDAQRARPVNAYHFHAIQWGVDAGKKRLLCGGGYAAGDGVFRFKASFSPLRAQFRVYKRIHDPHLHEGLVQAWSRHHGGLAPRAGYFPAYRSSSPPAGSPNELASQSEGSSAPSPEPVGAPA
jgi:hypothetical protein